MAAARGVAATGVTMLSPFGAPLPEVCTLADNFIAVHSTVSFSTPFDEREHGEAVKRFDAAYQSALRFNFAAAASPSYNPKYAAAARGFLVPPFTSKCALDISLSLFGARKVERKAGDREAKCRCSLSYTVNVKSELSTEKTALEVTLHVSSLIAILKPLTFRVPSGHSYRTIAGVTYPNVVDEDRKDIEPGATATSVGLSSLSPDVPASRSTSSRPQPSSSAAPSASASSGVCHLSIGSGVVERVTFQEPVLAVTGPRFKLLRCFGEPGSGLGQFMEPTAITTDKHGQVFVADSGNNRIQVFSPTGKVIRTFGEKGAEPGKFLVPSGVATDAAGNLIVVDKGNDRFQVFAVDNKDAFVRQFGAKGQRDGQFSFPSGVCVDVVGSVIVADTGNSRIHVITANEYGAYMRTFGSRGVVAGQFNQPMDVDVSLAGTVAVADTKNNRVQLFDSSDRMIQQIGFGGYVPGTLNSPAAVAIWRDHIAEQEFVIVADTKNSRVQVFSMSGQVVTIFGDSPVNDKPSLVAPCALHVTQDGDVLVADSALHCIFVYTPEYD